MFTRQQIEEIRQKLSLYAKKDTQFNEAVLPITGKEEISFVQNGQNVKMTLTDLWNNLLLFRATDFINLSDVTGNKYTLEEAIKVVPPAARKTGLVITFIDSNWDDWTLYQFRGQSLIDWTDTDKWEPLFNNWKFKGYFPNECLLYALCPYPEIGDYAFVGETLATSKVYRCVNKNVWSLTSENAIDYVKIIIDGTITVGENGNWFQNGVDTGIKAQGPEGKSPILRYHGEWVQWSYDGVNWENLVNISDFTIVNQADEEDIHSDKYGFLKFADKFYDPHTYSGLGRKFLRKHSVNNVNVITQEDFDRPNCRYIIQYDYELQGASITIPENCILDFQGGSFSNGTIVGNHTILNSSLKRIFNLNIILQGSWSEEFYPEWIGANGDGETDDSLYFQWLANTNIEFCIRLTNSYYIENTINIDRTTPFILKGNIDRPTSDSKVTIYTNVTDLFSLTTETAQQIRINGVYFKAKNSSNYDTFVFKGWLHGIIKNCKFDLYGTIFDSVSGVTVIDGNHFLGIRKHFINASITDSIVTSNYINGSKLNHSWCIKAVNSTRFANNFIDFWKYFYAYTSSNTSNVFIGNSFDNIYRVFVGPHRSTIVGNAFSNIDYDANNWGDQYLDDDMKSKKWCIIASQTLANEFPNDFTSQDGRYLRRLVFSNNTSHDRCNLLYCEETIYQPSFIYIRDNYIYNDVEEDSNFQYIGSAVDNTIVGKGIFIDFLMYKKYDNLPNPTITSTRGECTTFNRQIVLVDNISYINNDGVWSKYVENSVTNGSTDNRPILTEQDIDYSYFDTTLGKPIFWNGTSWIDADTYNSDALRIGSTTQRPTNVSVGFRYFDTTLNKPIIWNGSRWIEADSATASVLRVGTTAQRPMSGIYIGFQYYDTTLSKMIYWNGNSWIDSNGTNADIPTQGGTSQRPSNPPKGYVYYDTDLGKFIIWDGEKWIDYNGNQADTPSGGGSESRPENPNVGTIYWDETLNKFLIWNGEIWVELPTTPADTPSSGGSEERPADVEPGFIYWDEDLQKFLIWNGTIWVELPTTPADTPSGGGSDDRPTGIQPGYLYWDSTLNKFVIWNGTTWVDVPTVQDYQITRSADANEGRFAMIPNSVGVNARIQQLHGVADTQITSSSMKFKHNTKIILDSPIVEGPDGNQIYPVPVEEKQKRIYYAFVGRKVQDDSPNFQGSLSGDTSGFSIVNDGIITQMTSEFYPTNESNALKINFTWNNDVPLVDRNRMLYSTQVSVFTNDTIGIGGNGELPVPYVEYVNSNSIIVSLRDSEGSTNGVVWNPKFMFTVFIPNLLVE